MARLQRAGSMEKEGTGGQAKLPTSGTFTLFTMATLSILTANRLDSLGCACRLFCAFLPGLGLGRILPANLPALSCLASRSQALWWV